MIFTKPQNCRVSNTLLYFSSKMFLRIGHNFITILIKFKVMILAGYLLSVVMLFLNPSLPCLKIFQVVGGIPFKKGIFINFWQNRIVVPKNIFFIKLMNLNILYTQNYLLFLIKRLLVMVGVNKIKNEVIIKLLIFIRIIVKKYV